MLHKAPKLLAAAAGFFVVGVLVFTLSDRLGSDSLQGSLTPSSSLGITFPAGGMMSMSSSSFEPEPPAGWFDPDTLEPVPDPTMGWDGGTVGGTDGGTFGGTFGGDTGGAGGDTGGGAPMCGTKTKTIAKSYPGRKKACTCGSDGKSLQKKFEDNVKAGMNAACKDGATGPFCNSGCSVDGGTTVKNKVGPNFIGVAYDGGQPPCKKTQVRFCIESWNWSCDIEQKCKATSSSSSSTPPPTPTPTPPPPGSSFPSAGFKCCARNTPNASCITAGSSCDTGTSDGMTYGSSNCAETCNPTTSTSSSSM